jgi:flagellar protein FliJ
MQSSTLSMLIDIADKEVQSSAEMFAQANAQWQESEHKLMMLKGYREDYMSQFNANSKAGLSPLEYRNFQGFIHKLDEAITGQEAIVASHLQHQHACKKTWQAAQRKKMSFEVLLGNEAQKTANIALKREQKQMDEHASRMTRNAQRQ